MAITLVLLVQSYYAEELFCTQTVHLGPGLYTEIDLSSWVAIRRGSTEHTHTHTHTHTHIMLTGMTRRVATKLLR